MKKVLFLAFAFLLCAMVSSANAAPIKSLLFYSEENLFSDNSGLYLINADGTTIDNVDATGKPVDSIIVTGDRIRGWFNIGTISAQTGGGGTNVVGAGGNNEWSGVYELEVKNDYFANNQYTFILGPSAAYQSWLETQLGYLPGSLVGAALSMWEDTNVDYTREFIGADGTGPLSGPDDAGTVKEENLLGTATGGTNFWTFGFKNTDPNSNYWEVVTGSNDINVLKTAVAGTNSGTANFALDIIDNPSNVPLFQRSTGKGGLADITGSGSLLTVGGVNTPADAYDDFNVYATVPEPATMLLLGAGLIGLGLGRKAFFKR